MSVANAVIEALALPDTGAAKAPGTAAAVRGAAGAVLAVALLVGAAQVARALLAGGVSLPGAWAILRVLAGCVAAGLLEEALFRGAAFPLFIGVFRPARDDDEADLARAIRLAALVQAGIFALLHLTGTLPEALTWVVALQAVAKVASAFLFGVIMAWLYVATRNLLVPICVHVAYDLLALAPQEILFGTATTYLTGDLTDALIQCSTALLLAAATALLARHRGR